MRRTKKPWDSQQVGSFHIISRVAGGAGSDFILHDQKKNISSNYWNGTPQLATRKIFHQN